MIFYLLFFINFTQCANCDANSMSMINNESNINYKNNANIKKDQNNLKKETNKSKYFIIGVFTLVSTQIAVVFSFFYIIKHFNNTKQISQPQTSLQEIEIINENFHLYMSQVLWHLIAGLVVTILIAGLTAVCINRIYNIEINYKETVVTEKINNIDTIFIPIIIGYFMLLIWFYYLCYNPSKPSLLANILFYVISIINGLTLGGWIFISILIVNVITIIFIIFLGLLISGLWTYYSYTHNIYKKIFMFGTVLFSIMSIVSVGLLVGFLFSIDMIGLYIFSLIISIIINFYIISKTIGLLQIQYAYNVNIYPVWGAFLIYVYILDTIYTLLKLLIVINKKKDKK